MDAHEWVSLGTLAAALGGVLVQFVSGWWERRDRAVAERRHSEALQMQRDAQERYLLISMHDSLEKLRLRAMDVLGGSPAPQALESELVSAIRAARFQAGQLAAPRVRDAAIRAVAEGERVRDRPGFDERVDTHKQPDELVEAEQRLRRTLESAIDDAMGVIEHRLRELDPSPVRREESEV